MARFREGRTRRWAVLMLVAVGLGLFACGGGTESQSSVSVELQDGLMSRWNAVARGVTIDGPGSFKTNFEWNAFERFPHPTYKGGSEQAYQRFAELLVAFYENDDTFDFLAEHRLFRVPLRYVFPNGSVGIEVTFEGLTTQLAASMPLPISDETRGKLSAFADRIRTAP